MNLHPHLLADLARDREASLQVAAARARIRRAAVVTPARAPQARPARVGLGALAARLTPVRSAAPDQRC